MPFVYVVRCATGELYVGITEDLENRVRAHNEGTACLFTAKRRPVKLVYSESAPNIQAAVSRERQLKRWTRAKKEALVRGEQDSLRRLSQRRVW